VATAELADGAVTAPKLAADAVTGAKLADNAVGHNELGDDAVTGTEIANGSLTAADVGVLGGTATLAPVEIAPGCTDLPFAVAGLQVGDRVLLTADPDMDLAFAAQALTPDTAGQLEVRICNLSGAPVTPAAAYDFSYLVIR